MTSASPQFQTRPDLTGSFGMCASTHWIATATAQSVLERGGNAFDAAVAAGFVLHVVEPHLNGPGGDLVALIASDTMAPTVLVGQGPAPAAATIEHFRAEGLTMVPGAGALAAAVPGAVDAWLLLLRDHGTWELGAVLDYAIHYARSGHEAIDKEVETIGAVADLFREHWPTSAALWLRDGRVPDRGEILVNAAYARTLERVVDEATGGSREARIDAARAVWREGFVAESIARFVHGTPHRHSSGTAHRGVLTARDMSTFSASYEAPVSARFRDVEIVKAGAWTQGPVLLQMLTILDGYADDELDLTTGEGVHRVLETMKLALADREAYYGPRMSDATLRVLLSTEYAEERRAAITAYASHEFRPGTLVDGPEPFLPPLVTATEGPAGGAVGEPTVSLAGVTRGDTCHLDVVDRWGNIVSATPSGGWLQSSPAIPELGFALGTRLQMTWLDEESPSALRPGERPRTTLTPSLMLREGRVVSAFGTPGGDQQDQWQLVYLLHLLCGRLTPQQAIDAPAFHTSSFPGSFWPRVWTPGGAVVETRLGERIIDDLEERGHRVLRGGDWSLARMSSVSRDPRSGRLAAAANPRGAQGYAAGR